MKRWLGAAGLAVSLAMPAIAQQTGESYHVQSRSDVSVPDTRFWSGTDQVLGEPPPRERQVNLVIVFPQGAPGPGGVAALKVERKLTCAGKTLLTTGYSTYAADGGRMAGGDTLPAELARLSPETDPILKNILSICDPLPPNIAIVGAPGGSPKPGAITSVADAMAYVRKREADFAAVQSMPQNGRFVPFAYGYGTNTSVGFLDLDHHEQVDASTRMSWLLPSSRKDVSYVRVSYLVDCKTQKAGQEQRVAFDTQGKVVELDGLSSSSPLVEYGGLGTAMATACTLSLPVPGQRVYASVSEALSAKLH